MRRLLYAIIASLGLALILPAVSGDLAHAGPSAARKVKKKPRRKKAVRTAPMRRAKRRVKKGKRVTKAKKAQRTRKKGSKS